MKFFTLTVFIFFTTVSADLKKIREHFPLMSKQETSVNVVKETALKSNDVSVTLKRAYYAAAEMTSAKYKLNPATKISTFNSGKKILEATILSDTANLEARYIRYTIQQNAPSFLGYKTNLSSDKFFLIKHLASLRSSDPELFSSVYAYLLTYGKLTEDEKALIGQ